MIQSFSKVTVTSAGTPKQCSVNTPTPGPFTTCNGILIQAWPTNVGAIYIGLSTMNKSTGKDLVGILATPTANFIPSFSATIPYATSIDVSQFWVDADNSGDGVIISSVAA